MNKKVISRNLLAIVAISVLTIGCGSSSAVEKEPSSITTPTSTGTSTSTLNASQISAGVISSPVTVSVSTSDNTSEANVLLATGTGFEDSDGNTLDNVIPKLELTQTTENSEVTTKVQTEIRLTDTEGNKIIPTEAVTLKIKAPSNAKPGDQVRVSLPDGADKASGQEKLIIFIVDANGFLRIIIFPDVFKNFLVIVIIIERRVEPTGAEGGS